MNFKRYVEASDTWIDSHYIMGTSTDTITTPAVLYPNDTTATVGLKGNMSQSSTPTPTTPIQPQECGERTGNLVTSTNYTTANFYINVATLKSAVDNDNLFVLSIETNIAFVGNSLYLHTDSGNRIVTTLNGTGHVSATFKLTETDVSNIKSSNSPYFYIYKSGADFSSTSVELHSGYKIPILNNSQTTNVYLGEVESTRSIKKTVLDGTETTWTSGTVQGRMSFNWKTGIQNPTGKYVLCTHYKSEYAVREGVCFITSNNVSFIDSNFQSLDDFKNFLADEYAAGHPVIVWYVQNTPTTSIRNEPLRKIGDYADEVSGITIPTIAGANTLSVDTTLQPSEVTATYKGWHPVADVHKRDNSQWD